MTNNESHPAISTRALFEPFDSGKMTLANRIVMAPMSRGFSHKGVPGTDVADYYRRRAENGVGLIITEGTLIHHPAAAANPTGRIFTERIP